MDKENSPQPDLFLGESVNTRNKETSNNLFGYIRGYEKFILFFICLIVTAVIFFSLGVEKGKRQLLAAKETDNIADTAVETNKRERVAVIATKEQSGQTIQNATAQLATINPNSYVIQLASYKNKASALKEAENLKKKGFAGLVLPSRGYNIVCVGGFPNKDAAKPVITELKKKYKDALIRRM